MGGIGAVAARRQHRPRRGEGAGRRAEVAADQRDLGLGEDAARPRRRLARAEAAGGAAQQRARPPEVAELRHRDAAQRQRRGVVAQRHALQRRQRVAGGQRTAGGGDQRVHGNPVTLVTPAPVAPRLRVGRIGSNDDERTAR